MRTISQSSSLRGSTGARMRMSDFIEANVEPLLASWVEFARTQGQDAQAMDTRGLRDHAVEMLAEIVDDLREPQTPGEQRRKAEGALFDAAPQSAANAHGAGRARRGFTATDAPRLHARAAGCGHRAAPDGGRRGRRPAARRGRGGQHDPDQSVRRRMQR